MNVMRWMAALAVVLTHLDNRVFVSHSENPSGLTSAYFGWMFTVGFAHQAVVAFFVMSGWLVGGRLLKQVVDEKNVDLLQYFADRVIRLGIVLVPALALTYLLDSLGARLSAGTAIYAASADHLDAGTFACNVLYLQTIVCKEFGSNGALWSLANEFWYYLVWPLLLAPLMRRRSRIERVMMFSLAIVILVGLCFARYDTYPITPYFALWLLGVLGSQLKRPITKNPLLSVVLLILWLVGFRLMVRTHMIPNEYAILVLDIIVGMLVANVLVTMAHYRAELPNFLSSPVHAFLADRSYSLYATHVPIIMFLCALAQSHSSVGWKMIPGTTSAWLALAGIATLTLVSAFAFAQMTEVHTQVLRGWARRLLSTLKEVPSGLKPPDGTQAS